MLAHAVNTYLDYLEQVRGYARIACLVIDAN